VAHGGLRANVTFKKAAFLDELRAIKLACLGPSIICGDFNMIYRDQDKNQGILHRSWMRHFRRLIDDLLLTEVHLHGRLYTWSSERRQPTLERIDRVLADCAWLEIFSNHHLACLSTDCSDHAPLSLRLDAVPRGETHVPL
jgi:endonuclease/exonuclease/phosphatase family metal-dependent hydrolase